jgi:hypothetical protein
MLLVFKWKEINIEALNCSPDEIFVINTSQEKVVTYLKRKLNNWRQFYSDVSLINHGVVKALYFSKNFRHFNAFSWAVRNLLHYTSFILIRKPLLQNLLPWFMFISDVNLINANSSMTTGSLIDLLSDLDTCYSQRPPRTLICSYTAPPYIQHVCSFHRFLPSSTRLLLYVCHIYPYSVFLDHEISQ